jgi:hypothetical protein
MTKSSTYKNTIDTFFEAYRAGAFIKNPTNAHRAIRSLDEHRSIKSKEIRELAGDVRLQQPDDAIDILLKLVVVVLEDMRQNHDNAKKLSVFLREVLGPINCYLTNLESKNPNKGTKRFKFYVSTGVISSLENGKKPEVIFEHKIPIKVMRDEMIKKCFNSDSVLEYLKNNLRAAFITKSEDQKLIKYKDSIPENRDRYAEANIVLHEKPVYFRRGQSTMKQINRYD